MGAIYFFSWVRKTTTQVLSRLGSVPVWGAESLYSGLVIRLM